MRNGEGLQVWVSARNGDCPRCGGATAHADWRLDDDGALVEVDRRCDDCGLEFTSEYRVTSNFDFQQDGKAVARDEVLGW